jgi:hypothetical protein
MQLRAAASLMCRRPLIGATQILHASNVIGRGQRVRALATATPPFTKELLVAEIEGAVTANSALGEKAVTAHVEGVMKSMLQRYTADQIAAELDRLVPNTGNIGTCCAHAAAACNHARTVACCSCTAQLLCTNSCSSPMDARSHSLRPPSLCLVSKHLCLQQQPNTISATPHPADAMPHTCKPRNPCHLLQAT